MAKSNHHLKYGIYVSNTSNPDENSKLVAEVYALGDANIIVSALNKAANCSPLSYFRK
jgi:hypothetical protein